MGEEWLASSWLLVAMIGAGLVALALTILVLRTPVYKHIVCLKYLFCGWKAVVPFVSALPAALGVFLLVLVFAIMDGFVRETREMTRGTLSDVIVDAQLQGLPYYDEFIERIERIDGVEAATPVIHTFALARIVPRDIPRYDPTRINPRRIWTYDLARHVPLGLTTRLKPIVRPCTLIGIRPAEKGKMGRFREYLQRESRADLAAEALLEPPPGRTPKRPAVIAGVGLISTLRSYESEEPIDEGTGLRVLAWFLTAGAAIVALFIWQAARRRPGRRAWQVATGLGAAAVVALAITALLMPTWRVTVRRDEPVDWPLCLYDVDEVVVATFRLRPSGALELGPGAIPKAANRAFTLVDAFKSGYWAADSTHLYVDFEVAQEMAGMAGRAAEGDAPARPPRANQIQVKIRDPAAGSNIVSAIGEAWIAFAAEQPEARLVPINIETWENQQRMILTVVEIERNITALMLGLMCLGFGVLTALISYVMAYIKSRDVGILKALGARDAGVGSLFLGYGFIIGLIGTVVGLVGALLMLHYLDPIEIWVNAMFGVDVFPRDMYYFERIPRYISVRWCAGVSAAVLALATLSSTAGGLLAALRQPVEALRYE